MPRRGRARIYVLAGPNGAGKSSVLGAALAKSKVAFFNPDEFARVALARTPALTQEEANGYAWLEGKRGLERAIREGLEFGLETTLGANTIPALLEKCLDGGGEVRMWYLGLQSPRMHIERVRARVAAGGHDIPRALIRQRYVNSQANLVHLLPKLTEVWVYDNSFEADPKAGQAPRPLLFLQTESGRIVNDDFDLKAVPQWAKSIVMAALKHTH